MGRYGKRQVHEPKVLVRLGKVWVSVEHAADVLNALGNLAVLHHAVGRVENVAFVVRAALRTRHGGASGRKKKSARLTSIVPVELV